MTVISLRLNDQEEKLFKGYAELTGKTLSELFKNALADHIEDKLDYEIGVQSLKEFEEDPVTYTIDEMIERYSDDV